MPEESDHRNRCIDLDEGHRNTLIRLHKSQTHGKTLQNGMLRTPESVKTS